MEQLTLPFPIRLEYERGLKSLGSSGRCLAVRMHEDDINALRRVAETLDIPGGSLMRWFIVYSVREMHKQLYKTEITVRP